MTTLSADLVVLGSGFGGSLTALAAKRMGLAVVLIERHAHPRFAIGESSTPYGDLVLAELADRYDLPRIRPLAQYGSWRRAYPSLPCGLKRGFSYFYHRAGEPFTPRDDHANELLVSASRDDEHADTHWYRADFDAFLVGEVQSAGIAYLDRSTLTRIEPDEPWTLEARRDNKRYTIRGSFVVDASGGAGVLATALGIENDVDALHTDTRSIYAHFTGVTPWSDIYTSIGGRIDDHPYPSHAAALHHVFDGGWIYVLHFDHGVTSAGFVLDNTRHPLDASCSPDVEWSHRLGRLPSVAAQFDGAVPLSPLMRTGRMQRCARRLAGRNWAMLPHAGCFVDPLHSTGNAHTLSAVERLLPILQRTGRDRDQALARYERTTLWEVRLIDQLVHGSYASMGRFDLMIAQVMLYFAGAHYSETRRRKGDFTIGDAFLNADDARFRDAVDRSHRAVCRLAGQDPVSQDEVRAFEDQIAEAIRPYNLAGLCDPAKCNMYAGV